VTIKKVHTKIGIPWSFNEIFSFWIIFFLCKNGFPKFKNIKDLNGKNDKEKKCPLKCN
jgi:hypothetical protein